MNRKNGGKLIFSVVLSAGLAATVLCAEPACAMESDGWVEIDGVYYWYEGGVRQGYDPNNTAYRGKEIYDPGTDAWYWLDNVQNGAVAKNKDVYQESEAGEWGDIDGTDGKKYGKWVRYDGNGHMMKGWDVTESGTYYFDYIYGTMAKGEVVIDGETYCFDVNTGVLQSEKDNNGGKPPKNGWYNVNGTLYWYEGGIRQGYDPNNIHYRGKEIYDPGTDAWYWLDNVQKGAVAKNKDVYQESEAGEWGDIEGTDGKTYGKWVRYDENGHMIKGWDEKDGNKYYFEPITGAMVKGIAVIDGEEYNFDESTGILNVLFTEPNAVMTNNCSRNSYGTARYDYHNNVVRSYLMENEDGSITRLEYIADFDLTVGEDVSNGKLVIENYDDQFSLISSSTIPVELELFGGFYSGAKYNWLVFGQSNEKESDAQEVYRVVKYTKDWKRVGSCSLYGANTYQPFRSGTCRMTEYQGNLFIRTCHTMYDRGDGKHHQANVTIEVDQENLEITDSFTKVMNVAYGYVSHSFDQFIDTTDGVLTAVDLGDAYPRSIVLFQYPNKAEERKFTTDYYHSVKYVNLLKIPDAAGGSYAYNCTGVSIGGYRVSDSHYLAAYSSVDQSDASNQVNSAAVRNIYVAALPRDEEFVEEAVRTYKITNYAEGTAKTPHMVKISEGRYLLLWEYGDKINYTYIDNSGNGVDRLYSFTGKLSDCEPIVYDGAAVWYAANEDGDELVFYKLRADGRVFKKVIQQ